jgi:hypothetical protein
MIEPIGTPPYKLLASKPLGDLSRYVNGFFLLFTCLV